MKTCKSCSDQLYCDKCRVSLCTLEFKPEKKYLDEGMCRMPGVYKTPDGNFCRTCYEFDAYYGLYPERRAYHEIPGDVPVNFDLGVAIRRTSSCARKT